MKILMATLKLVAATLLVVCISSNLGEAWKEEQRVMHVGGKVLCQDCTRDWNEWLHADKPIKGSRVSVTCMDERGRVIYYGSDETDERGQFDMIINKYMNGKELKPRLCSARLVSSPDPVCNILTDFSGGQSGVKLSRPSVFDRDIIKYTLGPFYFTSPMCEEPDTTESSDDHGGNY